MKYFINLVLVLVLVSCSSSKKIKKLNSNSVVKTDTITEIDWGKELSLKTHEDSLNYFKSIVKVDWSEDSFLKPYKDSLNNITNSGIIPRFFLNNCFDYDNTFYWKPKHNPKSFRRQLIFSIKNIDDINFLINNEDKISNNICKKRLEHPYGGGSSKMNDQDLTNLQLLKLRLKELKN